jgi:hypothetical protein
MNLQLASLLVQSRPAHLHLPSLHHYHATQSPT